MPFHFGLTRKKFDRKTGEAIHGIAREHGADFIGPIYQAGLELHGWFSGPNLGDPFDRALRNAVMQDVKLAGFGWLFD